MQRPSYWRQAKRLLTSTSFSYVLAFFFKLYDSPYLRKEEKVASTKSRGQSHREEHTDSSNCRSCLSGQKAHWTCFTFLPKLPDFGPHPSRYLQKRLCVEVSMEEGNMQTATAKALLLLLASSDLHMKDFVHMKDHHITLFSWSSNIRTWSI